MAKDEVKIVGQEEIGDNFIEKNLVDVDEMVHLPLMKSISLPRSSVKVASRSTVEKSGCIVPPYNPSEFLRYKALDSTFQTCIEIKRDSTVGLGYSFGSKDIEKRKDIVDFFKTPNRNLNDTFLSIIGAISLDLDLFHNGYFEFVKSGKRRSIYYLPAKDMYIRPKRDKDGNFVGDIEKYCRIESDSGLVTEFYPYPIDGKTKDGVHYCIHIKKSSQENRYYGSPDNTHLFQLIKQSYLSDQYNINFFTNGGQPAWACLITGGKLSKKSYEKIKEFIKNNLTGVQNAHKMLFLSVPNEKADIKLVPLSKSIDEQFINLSEKTQFRIALKCRVHPKLLGLSTGGNFGGGSAGIADLKLFMETVSKPIQVQLVEVINKFLYLEFGIDCELSFNSMNISNEKDDAIIANIYWNMVDQYGNRAITINEVRQIFLKLKPIDLLQTPENEAADNGDSLSVGTNATGDLRTNNNTDLGIGDGEAPENLDPEKNKH